jgi:hypothetical protein
VCRACRQTYFRPAWISGFACPAALKAARTILIEFLRVKEPAFLHKRLIRDKKGLIFRLRAVSSCALLLWRAEAFGPAYGDAVLHSGACLRQPKEMSCAFRCSSLP